VFVCVVTSITGVLNRVEVCVCTPCGHVSKKRVQNRLLVSSSSSSSSSSSMIHI